MSKQTDSAVDVWHVPTTEDSALLSHYRDLLSNEENQRYQNIVQSGFHNTYVTVHAALRILLGKQLDLSPKSIEIKYPKNKKPHAATSPTIFFNLSHSKNMSLIAISKHHEVGVDVESIQKKRSIDAIADRFFTKKESLWLGSMGEKLKENTFYQLWCHKEALLKGQGTGLQGGLDKICLAEHDFKQAFYYKNWTIQSLSTNHHEKAAIAVNAKEATIIEHTWHSDKEMRI